MPFVSVDDMLGAGIHINAVGGDRTGKTELRRDILARASRAKFSSPALIALSPNSGRSSPAARQAAAMKPRSRC